MNKLSLFHLQHYILPLISNIYYYLLKPHTYSSLAKIILNSYTMNTEFSFFLVLTLVSFVLTTSDNTKDKEECTNSLVGLATCLPYVQGTSRSPTPDCCSGLKQLLKTNRKCLCVVIKDRNDPDLGLSLNVTLAMGLPQVCNAPANISNCPALLNLPPNSPDAQIFYQFGQKSSNSSAGGPSASVRPNPISPPAGTNASGNRAQQQTSGCENGNKKWFGLEILGGVILLWAFTSNMMIV